MKKSFFDLCYLATGFTIIISFISFYFPDSIFLGRESEMIVRGVSLLFMLILWIKCFLVWRRNDKGVLRFFLLLFLHMFYVIFYYPIIRSKKWI